MVPPGGVCQHALVTAALELPRRRPPAQRVLPRRIFYGWWITLGCGILLFVGVGVGFYILGILLDPLQSEHGWSNGAVSGASGLYFAVNGVANAVMGPRIDRHGPMAFMVAGVLGLGGCLVAVGHLTALWQLYLVYPLMGIAFAAAANVSVNSILTRWWIHRRARAMSVSFSFVSMGGALFAPLGTSLIHQGGIRLATLVLGLSVIGIGLPVVLLVLVWDPAQMGLAADDGHVPTRPVPGMGDQYRLWTRSEALHTVALWAMLIGFPLVMLSQVGFLTHQVAFLSRRFDSDTIGSLAIATSAVGSAVARLVVGTFADGVDKRRLTVTLIGIQAATVYGLVVLDNLVVDFGLVLVFGFTMGNIFMLQSLLVGEIFGLRSFGSIFGLLTATAQIAAGAGPVLIGYLEQRSGSYSLPLVVTATLTLLGGLAITWARPEAVPPPITSERPAARSG